MIMVLGLKEIIVFPQKYSILFNNHMQILLEVVCSAPFQNLWNTMKYTMLLTCQSMPPASRHFPLSGLSNQHWEWVDWSIISESGKGKTWTLFGKWKKTAAATTTTRRTRTRTGRKTKRQQPRILPFTLQNSRRYCKGPVVGLGLWDSLPARDWKTL